MVQCITPMDVVAAIRCRSRWSLTLSGAGVFGWSGARRVFSGPAVSHTRKIQILGPLFGYGEPTR